LGARPVFGEVFEKIRKLLIVLSMKKKDMQEENQINIELTEEIAEGVYANLAMIAHSNSEFVVDFIRLMPGVPKAKVKSRIILTPEHAQRLLFALQDNISKYEESFGEIRQSNDPVPFPMNFGGPIGEA
jgi:hypothetical protein